MSWSGRIRDHPDLARDDQPAGGEGRGGGQHRDGAPATAGPFPGKRRVEITVIRPVRNPHVDLTSFDSRDIHELLESGRIAAQASLS